MIASLPFSSENVNILIIKKIYYSIRALIDIFGHRGIEALQVARGLMEHQVLVRWAQRWEIYFKLHILYVEYIIVLHRHECIDTFRLTAEGVDSIAVPRGCLTEM